MTRQVVFLIAFILGVVTVISIRYPSGFNLITGAGSESEDPKFGYPDLKTVSPGSLTVEVPHNGFLCDMVPGCDRIVDSFLSNSIAYGGYHLFNYFNRGDWWLGEGQPTWVMTAATIQRRYHVWSSLLSYVFLPTAFLLPILFFVNRYFTSIPGGLLFLFGTFASMSGWANFYRYQAALYLVPFDFISCSFFFLAIQIADNAKINWKHYIYAFIYGQLSYTYLSIILCAAVVGSYSSNGIKKHLKNILSIVGKSAVSYLLLYGAVLTAIFIYNRHIVFGYTRYPALPGVPTIPWRKFYEDYAAGNRLDAVLTECIYISYRGVLFGAASGFFCFLSKRFGYPVFLFESLKRMIWISWAAMAGYGVVFAMGWNVVNFAGEIGRQGLPAFVFLSFLSMLCIYSLFEMLLPSPEKKSVKISLEAT